MRGELLKLVEETNKRLIIGTKVNVVRGPNKGAGGPIIRIDKEKPGEKIYLVRCKEFGDVWNKADELEINKD